MALWGRTESSDSEEIKKIRFQQRKLVQAVEKLQLAVADRDELIANKDRAIELLKRREAEIEARAAKLIGTMKDLRRGLDSSNEELRLLRTRK